MNISEVYSFSNYIRRKDPIGGSIAIPEFNILALIGQNKFFEKIFGLPKQYQKGARDPVFGFGLNMISEEKIRPLKVLPTSIAVVGGLADYPPDYFRKGTCYYIFTNPIPPDGTRKIEVPFVNDAKFNERLTSAIDPPALNDPVANLQKDKIRVAPDNLTPLMLSYIKYPATPVMGYVIDYATADNIYVDKGAYCQVVSAGVAGNIITLSSAGIQFGTYTVLSGDTAEDVMIGLMNNINVETLSHNVKAVYDGEKVVLIDNILKTYSGLTSSVSGGLSINKTNFTAWSVQFDWEDDIEAMNDISNIILDMMGISNRDVNIVQWAEKEKAKAT